MEWTDVKVKLPEDFKQVIVWCGFKNVLHITSIQIQNITTANHEVIPIRTWEGITDQQVTHWMPLPNKPIDDNN